MLPTRANSTNSGEWVYTHFFFVHMSETTKRNQLERIVEKVVLTTTYNLVLSEFVKSGKSWVLRVFIDSKEGIQIEDCQKVTCLMLDALEADDPMEVDYRLEVSSPGVDRPLVKQEDFEQYLRHRVYVKLHAPAAGRKVFTGELTACERDCVSVTTEDDNRSHSFSYLDIAKATLKPILKFDLGETQ